MHEEYIDRINQLELENGRLKAEIVELYKSLEYKEELINQYVKEYDRLNGIFNRYKEMDAIIRMAHNKHLPFLVWLDSAQSYLALMDLYLDEKKVSEVRTNLCIQYEKDYTSLYAVLGQIYGLTKDALGIEDE